MEWWFLICYVGLAVCVRILCFRIEKVKDKLASYSTISKEEWDRIILDTEMIIANVRFEKGGIYGYNSFKKIIKYEDKEEYTCFDIFALYHEVGHGLDDVLNKIFYHMRLIMINRLIVIPIYFIIVITEMVCNQYFIITKTIVIFIILLLTIERLYFIIKYEKSASYYALEKLEGVEGFNLIRILSEMAIKQQYILTVLVAMTTMFFYNGNTL